MENLCRGEEEGGNDGEDSIGLPSLLNLKQLRKFK